MNEVRSESRIDRYGRILAEEALKTHRNPEAALLAIQQPGELRWLWAHTDNPPLPSHLEDGPMTPFLVSTIRKRIEAERLVLDPPRLEAPSERADQARARQAVLEEIAALTLSWWCMESGERAARCPAVMKEVQRLTLTWSMS